MKKPYLLIATVAGLFGLYACGGGTSSEKETDTTEPVEKTTQVSEEEQALLKKAQAYFKVLPEAKSFDRPIAQLGKKLYYENALSVSNKMSCNTCHQLDKYGVDNQPTSLGHDDVSRGDRNSPTVYNAYFHFAQFWDGRAADLKEQAMGPVLNPVEMGMPDSNQARESIKKIAEYKALFEEAFPNEEQPITFENIAEAIAEFEHTLRAPSKFDTYLEGDITALTSDEQKGLETFINSGCITCHNGAGLGGSMYQKFGLVKNPYWDYTGSERHDQGRFEVTGKETDKQFFKVAALRDVTKTAPYFHDGSVASLNDAVKIMAQTQLGRDLSDEEITSIVTFLDALTGEIPEHALQQKAS